MSTTTRFLHNGEEMFRTRVINVFTFGKKNFESWKAMQPLISHIRPLVRLVPPTPPRAA